MKATNLKNILVTMLAAICLGFGGAALAYDGEEDDSSEDQTWERSIDRQHFEAGGNPDDDRDDSGEDKGW